MIYFAYGSNMDLDQMKIRCPGSSVIGIGQLTHYTMAFTRWSRSWKSGTADILPERGAIVHGVLFNLTLDGLKKLDKFADYSNSYLRQDVTVIFGVEVLPAMTYVARRQGVYLPSKSYLGKMVQGGIQNHLPEEYIEYLKSIQTHD